MKRFRPENLSGNWTRRGAIAAVAGLAACNGPPATAQLARPHPLWPTSGPPVLRGAVIAQRRRRIEVDGDTFGGGAAVLPSYRRSDFGALAEAGANLVVMSFPELWSVKPPYRRDNAMADMLAMIRENPGHPASPKWLEEFRGMVTAALPEGSAPPPASGQ